MYPRRHTPRCCCPCSAICSSLSGLAQFVVSVLLLFLASDALSPAGECPFGTSQQAENLCSSVTWLALASIFSGMLLFVGQNLLSVFCAPRGCVDVSGRGLLAVGWLVAAVFSTIQGVKASHAPSSAGLMWTTIGLCWAMFVLALAMAITTMVLHAADCCAPDSPFGLHSGPLALCAEVLCVAWLVRWLTGDHSRPAANSQGGYTFYTPVAGGPSQGAPSIPHSRQQRHSLSSGYHEHLMHAHVPVTVVHPVSEHLTHSFYGPTGGGGAVPHQHAAHPVSPFQPPVMQPSFGLAPPAVGLPVAPHSYSHPQQGQYPEVPPAGQAPSAQYPSAPGAPAMSGKDAPSAPPMPQGRQ